MIKRIQLDLSLDVLEFHEGCPTNYDVAISIDEEAQKKVIADITIFDQVLESEQIQVE